MTNEQLHDELDQVKARLAAVEEFTKLQQELLRGLLVGLETAHTAMEGFQAILEATDLKAKPEPIPEPAATVRIQ